MSRTITVTESQLAAALTEWDRRWKENPERFLSEAEMLTQDSSTYGSASAPYLISILDEQGTPVSAAQEPA